MRQQRALLLSHLSRPAQLPAAAATASSPPECELTYALAGPDERRVADPSRHVLLPPHSEYLVYARRGGGYARCALGGGAAVLQLPKGAARLPLAAAAAVSAGAVLRVLPAGALLRIPHDPANVSAPPRNATADGDPHLAAGRRLVDAPHQRCVVPPGALLALAEPAVAADDVDACHRSDRCRLQECGADGRPPPPLVSAPLNRSAAAGGAIGVLWSGGAQAAKPRVSVLLRVGRATSSAALRRAFASLAAQDGAAYASVLVVGDEPLCAATPRAAALRAFLLGVRGGPTPRSRSPTTQQEWAKAVFWRNRSGRKQCSGATATGSILRRGSEIKPASRLGSRVAYLVTITRRVECR